MARHRRSEWPAILVLLSAMLVFGACARPVAPLHVVRAASAPGATLALHTSSAEIREAYGRLPLYFEENRGQAERDVKFVARVRGGTVSLGRPGARLRVRESDVRMSFVDGRLDASIAGIAPQPTRINYFVGNERSQWRTDIPTYGRVRYAGIYPGIDAVFYGNQRELEYDFVVAPGADPRVIRLRFEGAEHVALDGHGNVRLDTAAGTIFHRRPIMYQDDRAGGRTAVPGRYVMRGRNEVGFEVAGPWDRTRTLVIDPVITYSTLFGGSIPSQHGIDSDYINALAVDAAGSAYIAGFGHRPEMAPAAPMTTTGNLFVAKLNPSGTALEYAAYIGISASVSDLAIDSAGNAYVVGRTDGGLPVVNAVQPTKNGGMDGFVVKLNASGNALVYSTYLGGSQAQCNKPGDSIDDPAGVAVDSAGSAYVVGTTESSDFPTTAGAYQTTGPPQCPRTTRAYLTKFAPDGGSLVYSTYLGPATTSATAVAVDAGGHAYVSGFTWSDQFPTTPGAFKQSAPGSSGGSFVAKVNPSGSALVYATLYDSVALPGTPATIYGLAIDAAGNAYVAGTTHGGSLPTVNAFQPSYGGSGDAFVAKFNATGGALVYSTYLGGSAADGGFAIAVDGSGAAYVSGNTASSNFPTVNPLQANPTSGVSAFLVKLNAAGTITAAEYSTTFGYGVGGVGVTAHDVAVDGSGNAYIAGSAFPADGVPVTPGAYQTTGTGGEEGFVAKISPGGAAQPVVWTSVVKATVNGNTITKTSGCEGCADAGAVSQQTIESGDGFVEFKVSSQEYLTVGLSNGNPGTSGTEIDFGLRFHAGTSAAVQVRESGVYKAEFLHIDGATYKVAVEGGAVKYYQNGALKYTSTLAPTYPLLVDTSLLTLGASVQNAMISTGGGGGTPPPDAPPTVSITAPTSDATVSGNAVTVSANASDDLGVASVQFQLDGVNLGTADTTSPYSITWDTTTATNGPHTLTAIATDSSGQTTTSAPVTVTVDNGGSPLPGPGPGPVVWTSAVNVAVSGNSITKNAGCNGCADAGAISEQTIPSGGGSVSFGIGTGSQMMVGLGTGNAGTSGTDVEFGLRFYPGSPGYVEVRESGAYKWDFAHVPGATYKVAVETGVVKYYQNGTLKYTSTAAPSFPLVVDSSLVATGSAVQNAVIGP